MQKIELTIDSLEMADAHSALGYLNKAIYAVKGIRTMMQSIDSRWETFEGTSLGGYKSANRKNVYDFYEEAKLMMDYCNSGLASLGICFSLEFDGLLLECYKKIDEFNPKPKKR